MEQLRFPVLILALFIGHGVTSLGAAEPCHSESGASFLAAQTVTQSNANAAPAGSVALGAPSRGAVSSGRGSGIIHDAEYYILEAQHHQAWGLEDQGIEQLLAALRRKHGRPPNIVHIMWNDQSFGSVGIPAMQPMRGFTTPRLNRMATEGMVFTRMYSEVASTPTRGASMTGQHPVRNGMYQAGFPIGYRGLSADNETIAEILLRAGYATGFFGKFHLGDIAVSYPHHQGFDESFFALYGHAITQWNQRLESIDLAIDQQAAESEKTPLDQSFLQRGYVFYMEGERGGETSEWCGTGDGCFSRFDPEAQRRAIAFMQRYAECGKPFYVAWWPLHNPVEQSTRATKALATVIGENEQPSLDQAVGEVLDTLDELGLSDNTLVIAMSANGPRVSDEFGHAGYREGPFRGGQGDFLEGGVRVSAQAWWPGVIGPQQIVNDMLHVTDLYTTFARIAGASSYLPKDRIIDGLDQTALLLNGPGYGRRDFNFIYRGPRLAAIVKQKYKIHWLPDGAGGTGQEIRVFDLLHDPREVSPLLVGAFQFKEPFRRMRSRHEQWLSKYPHRPEAKGPAYTGLTNARPETLRVSRGIMEFQGLPFDPMGFIEHELPFDATTAPGSAE